VNTQFTGLWKILGGRTGMMDLFVGSVLSLNRSELDDIAGNDLVLAHFTSPTGEDVGRLPRSSLAGDELCVIAGARYPFVVRDN
jgi:hypothetical protein